MFCPADYVVMDRIASKFAAKVREIYPVISIDDYAGDMDDLERKNNLILEKRHKEKESAIHRFLKLCETLSICAPDGRLLRVSEKVIFRAPSKTIKSFSGYWFIDVNTWIIDTEKAVERIERMRLEVAQREGAVFLLRKTGQNRKASETEERIHRTRGIVVRVGPLLEFFKQFNGWALTVHSSEMPQALGDLDRYFSPDKDLNIGDDEDLNGNQIGRPSKQALALASYWKLYPEGHADTSWKEVSREVSNNCGVAVGKDTLRRALGLRQ